MLLVVHNINESFQLNSLTVHDSTQLGGGRGGPDVPFILSKIVRIRWSKACYYRIWTSHHKMEITRKQRKIFPVRHTGILTCLRAFYV